MTNQVEFFVDADKVAEFLALPRTSVTKLARAGRIPAYPIFAGERCTWRFKLSEVAAALKSRHNGDGSARDTQ